MGINRAEGENVLKEIAQVNLGGQLLTVVWNSPICCWPKWFGHSTMLEEMGDFHPAAAAVGRILTFLKSFHFPISVHSTKTYKNNNYTLH
jgi:hypothetical protein